MSETIKQLEIDLDIMIHALKLKAEKAVLGRNTAVQYTVKDFGVVICGIERLDYQVVNDILKHRFEGWRMIYVTTEDNILNKKFEVIWDLMRSGYMKWVRITYPREFTNLMAMHNFSAKIIDERLRIWANQPKYKKMIEENTEAKRLPVNFVLASDASFFDYMP